MEFVTAFTWKPIKGEVMSDETQTVQAFMPLIDQIREMEIAGARLDGFKLGLYDWNDSEDVDLDAEDPTRDPGFDLEVASAIGYKVGQSIRKQREAAEKSAREKDELEQLKLDLEAKSPPPPGKSKKDAAEGV